MARAGGQGGGWGGRVQRVRPLLLSAAPTTPFPPPTAVVIEISRVWDRRVDLYLRHVPSRVKGVSVPVSPSRRKFVGPLLYRPILLPSSSTSLSRCTHNERASSTHLPASCLPKIKLYPSPRSVSIPRSPTMKASSKSIHPSPPPSPAPASPTPPSPAVVRSFSTGPPLTLPVDRKTYDTLDPTHVDLLKDFCTTLLPSDASLLPPAELAGKISELLAAVSLKMKEQALRGCEELLLAGGGVYDEDAKRVREAAPRVHLPQVYDDAERQLLDKHLERFNAPRSLSKYKTGSKLYSAQVTDTGRDLKVFLEVTIQAPVEQVVMYDAARQPPLTGAANAQPSPLTAHPSGTIRDTLRSFWSRTRSRHTIAMTIALWRSVPFRCLGPSPTEPSSF